MADPQDTYGFEEDFQKTIVAASLQDPTFLKQFNDVVLPGYFDYDYLTSILRTVRELTERLDEVPTKMSVVEELKEYCERFHLTVEDRDYVLNRVEDLYALTVNDLDYVRDRVVQFGQRQALRSAVLQVVTLFNADGYTDAAYEKAKTKLEDAFNVGMASRDPGLSVYPNLLNLPAMAASTASGLDRKIPTMFPTIDQKTMGGPGRGEVWVVVGLPGRGKSAFLANIGVGALKNGFPVFHFTVGDLNEVDVGIRYAARLTHCSIYEVITNSEKYVTRAKIVGKYNPGLYIKYFSSDAATMGHVRAQAAKWRTIHEAKPGVIIVDYPEELLMPVKDNLYLSGGSHYASMKKMGDDFEAVVWAASQPKTETMLKQAVQDPHFVIKGQQMAESGKKFQKVDGFCSWNMTYEEELLKRGRLWVDKTRRARSYYLVHCETDLEKMIIREGKPPPEAEGVA